jgi:hypothetical protein
MQRLRHDAQASDTSKRHLTARPGRSGQNPDLLTNASRQPRPRASSPPSYPYASAQAPTLSPARIELWNSSARGSDHFSRYCAGVRPRARSHSKACLVPFGPSLLSPYLKVERTSKGEHDRRARGNKQSPMPVDLERGVRTLR